MKWKEWSALAENESLWAHSKEKGLLKAEYIREYVLHLWFEGQEPMNLFDILEKEV
ncbi:MAG: hypothetical protein HY961_09995 [Ignavibacteriae bacterium]|nr:hypothetical protein [Ignavibacteriota bacterium]